LKSVTGLGAVLNTNFIFPGWTTSATVPYISFTMVSGVFDTTKGNVITMSKAIFQVEVYAETYTLVNSISQLIKTHINGYGDLSGHSFYLEDERDGGEEEAKKFRRSLDIAVEKHSL
jgi:hypothetical protein